MSRGECDVGHITSPSITSPRYVKDINDLTTDFVSKTDNDKNAGAESIDW